MRLTGGQMAQEHIRCHPAFLVEVMQGGDTRRHQGTIQHNQLTWHHQCWSSTGRYLRTSSSACLLSAGLSLSLDMWARGSRRQRKNFLPPCTSNPCPGFSSCSLSLTPGEKQKGAKGKNKGALSKYIGPVVCWDERENPCWLEPPSHLLHGGDWPRQQSMRFDYNYCLNAELKLFRACRAYGSRQASKITFGLETPWQRDGTKRQTSKSPPASTSRRVGLSLPVCDLLHAAPAFSPALADTLLARREKPHLWLRDHGLAQPD